MAKNRILVTILITGVLLAAILPAMGTAQTNIDNLTEQINQLERQAKKQAAEKDKIEKALEQNKFSQKNLQEDIMALDLKTAEKEAELKELQLQIDDKKKIVNDAAQKLLEAEKRVQERDSLLKTRVRSMYISGEISYLEVLLGSKNFGDFLQRLYALKLIVNSDVNILEKQKHDRDIIEQKKIEIENELEKLKKLFSEVEQVKQELAEKRKNKAMLIASLQKEEQELEEIEEEYKQHLLELVAELEKKYKQRDKIYYQGGLFHWPVPGYYRISSSFGIRKDPFTGKSSGHEGLDIPAPAGTDIVAAESGIVILAEYVRGYGYTVVIDHGNNLQTWYCHGLGNGFQVKAGQEVEKGQHIHEVGSTGRSTGNHLHFGVYKNGVAVDPSTYLKSR